MITAQVWMDGRRVTSAPVTTKAQLTQLMEAHPPTAARGGVVVLIDGRERQVVALSRHSFDGPIWGWY